MRASKTSLSLALACASMACIPSFPPCDCGKPIDRTEECNPDIPLPIEGAECGYPAGPYGFTVGDVFENLALFDCMGNPVQIAQYIPQAGLPTVQTRGVVFGVGALWCMPCRVEAEEWRDHFVDEYGPQGILFIQALDEANAGAPMTPESCAGYSATVAEDKFPILYYLDPSDASDMGAGDLQKAVQVVPAEPLPYTIIFDHNATITYRQTGGIVDPDVLTVQIEDLIDNES
jgi:hypothetical protein